MRQRTYLPRVALAALLVAALASESAAQPGRVGGVVKDDRGDAIKGATILAENTNIGASRTATTDEKGRFTIIGLRSGVWRFVAFAPGHAAGAGNLNVRAGGPNPLITFSLKRTGPGTTGALAGIGAKDLQEELAAADALFNQRKWDEAVAAYRSIMSKTRVLSVINLQIAAAYRNKKDFASAIDAYNAILTVDPNNEKAQVGIAMTNLERGDTKAAEDGLQKAAEKPTAGREVFFSLGEVKSAGGNADEAAKWYEKASAADPSWGRPLYRLGLLALKKGDTEGATKFLEQVLSVDPISPDAALAKATLDQLNK